MDETSRRREAVSRMIDELFRQLEETAAAIGLNPAQILEALLDKPPEPPADAPAGAPVAEPRLGDAPIEEKFRAQINDVAKARDPETAPGHAS